MEDDPIPVFYALHWVWRDGSAVVGYVGATDDKEVAEQCHSMLVNHGDPLKHYVLAELPRLV